MDVLVTGAAGFIGVVVAKALKEAGHDVRGFDREAGEFVTHTGDLTDADAVRRAVEGVEAVVHLAACPDKADFVSELVPPNVIGLYHVLEACRDFGVNQTAIASSLQVIGRRLDHPARVDDSEPRNGYALTKLWAEQMAAMYVRCHEMNILAARISWFPRTAEAAGHMEKHGAQRIYFSHADAGRFFRACVEREWTGFHVVYASSRVPPGETDAFDMAPGRDLLGWEPQDVFPQGLSFDYP